ncbi:MAG: Rieske 2Fe-2S domain-containing protein [Alphaproteobacteria bacterium]|jgi:nitrite reductase/ring-hydroxylating ferredoxin subunit|nr:Rieske 2Fe-2S domain-containing protein [Alphaproteobacteria bacterium]
MDISPQTWRAVAQVDDVSETEPLEIAAENRSVMLLRIAGEIRALQGNCPHAAARLAKGRVEDGWLHCPHHKARFRLTDGVCGPGWGLPALLRYMVKLEDETVYLAEPLVTVGKDD